MGRRAPVIALRTIAHPTGLGLAPPWGRAEDRAMLRRSRRGAIVLVVDDDPDVRTRLADIIDAEGYTAVRVPDGETALRILRGTRERCLLLLDLFMPGVNGFDVLDEIDHDRSLPEVNVVAMRDGDLGTGFMGGVPILRKPIDPWDLLDHVERLAFPLQNAEVEAASRDRAASTGSEEDLRYRLAG